MYRGGGLGSVYRGRYFFADYVSSRVWSLGLALVANGEADVTDVVEHTGELGGSLGNVASFGRDRDGELYLVTFSGRILKIVGTAGAVPPPPQQVTARVSGQTVTVSWMPPAGAAISGFQLEAGSVPGAANLAVTTTAAAQSSLTFSGVPVGTYYVRVRSLNASAASTPSNEVIVAVGTSGCVTAPLAPLSLASVVNGRSVTLHWDVSPTSAAASQWIVEAGSAATLANLAVISLPGTSTALTVQAPPGTYFVRVRGANACGGGAQSREILVSVM